MWRERSVAGSTGPWFGPFWPTVSLYCIENEASHSLHACPFVPLQTIVIFQTGRSRSEFSTCCVCSKHCQSDSISNHFIDQQGFECWIIPTNGWRIVLISAAVWLSALGASLPLHTTCTFHHWQKETMPVCCDKKIILSSFWKTNGFNCNSLTSPVVDLNSHSAKDTFFSANQQNGHAGT